MKKWFIGGLGALGFGVALAIAQVPTLFISPLTGNEQIEAIEPSTNGIVTNPQKQVVTVNMIRNSEGYTLVGAGTTVTTQIGNGVAVLIATGAITTWNVNLPLAPTDGQISKVTCPGGNVGTAVMTATSPAVIVGASFTSCTQATPTDAAWHYSASNTTWYRTE